MRRLAYIFLLTLLAGQARALDLELLRQPRNGAISPPMGQGLDLIHSAEPLGKGRFRVRIMNRSHTISLPELGNGSSYTGDYGLAYGFSDALQIGLRVPFLMDSAGGLNKYGSGDPVVSFKLSRPGKLPGSFYTAYQLLIGLPLGYKGEHGLDKLGGVRSFSSESVDLGLQVLMDIHTQPLSIFLNGGFYRSANPLVLPQLVYGLGLETFRTNRWASFNLEYQARVAFTEQARAAGILKFGTRINLFRGVELELNREFGFLEHPTDALFTFGVRLHGLMTGRRRLESRQALYEPPPPIRRQYQPTEVLRIAIIDFEGFEEYGAGRRLVDKIKTRLEPHDSLEVVDLSRYAGIPRQGFLKPQEALELARKLGVDVVLTGAVRAFEVDRFAGPTVPYIFTVPSAEARVELRYRILEFDPAKVQVRAFTEEIDGRWKARKRVRLLPADRHDITATATAGELQNVQEAALDNLVGNMLASMAAKFSWMPPDFLP